MSGCQDPAWSHKDPSADSITSNMYLCNPGPQASHWSGLWPQATGWGEKVTTSVDPGSPYHGSKHASKLSSKGSPLTTMLCAGWTNLCFSLLSLRAPIPGQLVL